MQLAIARILLFLVGLAGAAAALTTDNVAQQLDVTPGGKLVVDVDFGTVEVSAGAENHVDVDGERRIETDNEALERDYLAAAPITVSKDGNIVRVDRFKGAFRCCPASYEPGQGNGARTRRLTAACGRTRSVRGPDRQRAIYLDGVSGRTPRIPTDAAGLEARARDAMSDEA